MQIILCSRVVIFFNFVVWLGLPAAREYSYVYIIDSSPFTLVQGGLHHQPGWCFLKISCRQSSSSQCVSVVCGELIYIISDDQ